MSSTLTAALPRFPLDLAAARVTAALAAAGADARTAAGTTRALTHASLHGVDSHGFRLAVYYTEALRRGGIIGAPQVTRTRQAAGAGTIDAGLGLGHAAVYEAVDFAADLATEAGIAAVSVTRSTHIGAIGAYAEAGARRGVLTLAFSNSDVAVKAHDGLAAAHGTNPIAAGAPMPDEDPWLLDMATSSVPMNRVLLARSLGLPLIPGVAADAAGDPTTDAAAAAMLFPLGGTDFGFKGAALAGLVTLLAAALTASPTDTELPLMLSDEAMSAPRGLGQLVIAIDPALFGGREAFARAIRHHVTALRQSPAAPGTRTLAPGDRERAVAQERRQNGIPLDPATCTLLGL